MVPWDRSFPDNVWLGTTIETQVWAKRRAPELPKHPARVRFVSCEPLLGPVDLTPWLERTAKRNGIDWVIAGGESGHHATVRLEDFVPTNHPLRPIRTWMNGRLPRWTSGSRPCTKPTSREAARASHPRSSGGPCCCRCSTAFAASGPEGLVDGAPGWQRFPQQAPGAARATTQEQASGRRRCRCTAGLPRPPLRSNKSATSAHSASVGSVFIPLAPPHARWVARGPHAAVLACVAMSKPKAGARGPDVQKPPGGGLCESMTLLLMNRLGGGSPTWARTRDLRINSPALYRLSYRGSASKYSRKAPRHSSTSSDTRKVRGASG